MQLSTTRKKFVKPLMNFFANVGKTIDEKISESPALNCFKYLCNRVQNSILLEQPSINEILNIICSLKYKKTSK